MNKAMLVTCASLLSLSGTLHAQDINQTLQSTTYSNAQQKTKQTGSLYTTPSVPQAAYFAGANPCLVGVGAGASGGPVGLSFAIGRSDEGCQRRSDAGAWHSLGFDDIAIARMCQDDENRSALEATGRKCPQGVPVNYIPTNFSNGPNQLNAGTKGTVPPGPPPAVLSPSLPPRADNGQDHVIAVSYEIAPGAPTFCRTPGLSLTYYPECLKRNN